MLGTAQIGEFFVTRSVQRRLKCPPRWGYKGVVDSLWVLSQITPSPLEESPQLLLKRWTQSTMYLSWDFFPLLPQQIGSGLEQWPKLESPWTKEHNWQSQKELKDDPSPMYTWVVATQSMQSPDLEKQACWGGYLLKSGRSRGKKQYRERIEAWWLSLPMRARCTSLSCSCDIPHVWTIASHCRSCSLHCRNPRLQSKWIPRWIMKLD